MTVRRLLAAWLALVAALVAAAVVAAGTGRAAAAPSLTGTWKGFPGTLVLVQKGTAVSGTFAMAVGCTATYAVRGSASAAGAVSLALTLARNGKGGAPCAPAQTMKGTARAAGLSLTLVNAYQASPATPYVRLGVRADR